MVDSKDIFPKNPRALNAECITGSDHFGETVSLADQNSGFANTSLPSESRTAQQQEKLRKRLQLEKLEREVETRERIKDARVNGELQVQKINSPFPERNDSTSSKGKGPWTMADDDSQSDKLAVRHLSNIQRDDWNKKRKELEKGLRSLRVVFHDEQNLNQPSCDIQE